MNDYINFSCNCGNFGISEIIAILTLLAAFYVPEKIKWEQRYNTLLEDYRSFDFAVAIQGVINFFYDECQKNEELVSAIYYKRFVQEVENCCNKNFAKEEVLHYQRRLLSQYFYSLNECSKSPFIGKRRVAKDFTKSEADIIKILYLMNKAVDENGAIYKNIATNKTLPRYELEKGMNKLLLQLYELLKNSNRTMQV